MGWIVSAPDSGAGTLGVWMGKTSELRHNSSGNRFQTFDALLKSYVQLFWVYFAEPVTETQKDELLKIKPIRGVAVLNSNFTDDLDASPQYHLPLRMWATHTESVDGQEARLMVWPHFWKDANRAEIRHLGKFTRFGNPIVGGRTKQEIFCEKLNNIGPMSWTEEILSFKPITDV